jgi:hypothetical protein
MVSKNWFKKAVMDKPPYTTGWHKNLPQNIRLARTINSRPSSWSMKRKLLSSSRALQALSNVTRDAGTRMTARNDALKLMNTYHKM